MDEADPKRLGALLRARRLQLGLSMERTAAKADIDLAGLSRAESGQRVPAPATLGNLSRALDLPLADLYEIAGYPLPALPSLRPYLRRAYGMPEAAMDEVEIYLQRIANQYGGQSQPERGEDETV